MSGVNLLVIFLISLLVGMAWWLHVLRRELARLKNKFKRDVTHRIGELQIQNAVLVERAEQAEAATKAKSAFLASVSHEIRSPLNAILGMAYLMRRAGTTQRQSGQLDRIDRAARYLLAVLGDVLDLSKIEAGKLVLESRDFRLSDMIDSLVSVIGDSLGAKGVVFQVVMEDMPEFLRGDDTRLSQALLNYLSNAAKFTDAGSVSLSGRVEARNASGFVLHFQVVDTGVGISSAHLPHLFQPFEQAEGSTTRRFGGTGLGLSVTRKIVEAMGGEVGAESVPGRGSRFWLTVSLQQGAVTQATPAAHSVAEEMLVRHFHGTRVLLVEDEPVNQEVGLELLRDVGLEPDLAINGMQAVEMGLTGVYAVILMDMQLPIMDGIEASRALRAGGCNAQIVAMTGNALAEDRIRCGAAGMDGFMTKPVDPEELFATLLRCLSGRQAVELPDCP